MTNLVTYKIVSDIDGRLKASARTACNFWNRFIEPSSPIIIRLGVFTEFGSTIARAYEPYTKKGRIYGVVEFNTKYLAEFTDVRIAGTIVHEIGHTLGYGWEKWDKLYESDTGRFKSKPVKTLPGLNKMRVETDYGPGTVFAHWDEEKFGAELMTGFQDDAEYVLPVTIDVVGLLGHRVIERLKKKAPLQQLLTDLKAVQFARKEQAKAMDLDHFVPTSICEEIYNAHRRRKPV